MTEMVSLGMLWYDDDPKKSIEKKIQEGSKYYRDKYGKWPTCIYVHKSVEIPTSMSGHVLPTKSILKHHFWIGEK